ncbi:MAG: hypothetical protein LBP87_12850 [Planctomycetaceae bacterium]|jgi:hypothetical protein|nr:hypothetical protein [Planctomycetaceae bacterium]
MSQNPEPEERQYGAYAKVIVEIDNCTKNKFINEICADSPDLYATIAQRLKLPEGTIFIPTALSESQNYDLAAFDDMVAVAKSHNVKVEVEGYILGENVEELRKVRCKHYDNVCVSDVFMAVAIDPAITIKDVLPAC